MEQAEAGQLNLAFTDAAHFVYGKLAGRAWLCGRQLKATGHSRWRLNVYGAYDVASGEVFTHYSEDGVNAEFIVEY